VLVVLVVLKVMVTDCIVLLCVVLLCVVVSCFLWFVARRVGDHARHRAHGPRLRGVRPQD
jgi:hypothetical protein